MTSEEAKFEIIDFSGEKMSLFKLQFSIVMLICIVIAVIGLFFYFIFFPSLIALFISIGIILVVFLYTVTAGNQGMLRKFTIYESMIEILLPTRDPFIII